MRVDRERLEDLDTAYGNFIWGDHSLLPVEEAIVALFHSVGWEGYEGSVIRRREVTDR